MKIYPEFEKINTNSESNVTPIYAELFADITTTVSVLNKLIRLGKKCYLFESVESEERWGRYSFLGCEPKMTISANYSFAEIETNGETEIIETNGKPFDILRKLQQKYSRKHDENMNELPSFTGGLVGYTSFESGMAASEKSEAYRFMLFDKVIAFDHLRQKIFVIVNILTDFDNETLRKEYDKAVSEIKEIVELIETPEKIDENGSKFLSAFKSDLEKESWRKTAEKAIEEMENGKLYQLNSVHSKTAKFEGNLLRIYRILRKEFPSPYMYYINFGKKQLAGASPKTFVKVNSEFVDLYVMTETDDTPNGEKARIHQAIVDSCLNDVSKLSELGTVSLTEKNTKVKIAKRVNLTTIIKGKLREGLDVFDAIEAVSPAAVMSGVPRKNAVRFIKENCAERSVFSGSVGYIDLSGNLDMCLGMRLISAGNGEVKLQNESTITPDSDLEKVYLRDISKLERVIKFIY